MTDGDVRLDVRGPVAHILFEREESRNAMTWTMYERLGAACEQILNRNDVRAVVLRGAGNKAFVAGTDISQFSDFAGGSDGLEYEARVEAILAKLERLPMPTIAVIDGYAVGGGLAIAAVCDFRICSPNAKFGLPIARTLGNCLSIKNHARLSALVGPAHAKRLILGAQFIDASDALMSGLATEVIDSRELDCRVEELCAHLIRLAPLTIWAAKEAMRRLLHAGIPSGEDLIFAVYESSDFAEGVDAFVSKRSAEWTGR